MTSVTQTMEENHRGSMFNSWSKNHRFNGLRHGPGSRDTIHGEEIRDGDTTTVDKTYSDEFKRIQTYSDVFKICRDEERLEPCGELVTAMDV